MAKQKITIHEPEEDSESILSSVLATFSSNVVIALDYMSANFPLWANFLENLQHITGFKKPHLLVSVILVPLFMLVMLYFAPILLSMPFLLYSTIMSVLSIERKQPDRTRWLLFWLIYSCVNVLDQYFQFFLKLIPAYGLIKHAYFAWCMAPIASNGSVITYQVLRPILLEQLLRIDDYMLNSLCKLETVVRGKEGVAAVAAKLGASLLNGKAAVTTSRSFSNEKGRK